MSANCPQTTRVAEALNRDCDCVTLDRARLRRLLEKDIGRVGLVPRLLETRPHLFAGLPAFLGRDQKEAMEDVVRAVETALSAASVREGVLSSAPPIARPPATRGVLYSYDFHLSAEGPKLIEINSNAGGALLSLYAASALRREGVDRSTSAGGFVDFDGVEQAMVEMFRSEWRQRSPESPLRTIAIVDEHPPEQFLYPEMLLFQKLFERRGIETRLADPSQLRLHDGALWIDDLRIDLVYNRLTDFYLERPEHATLREAYRREAAVVTPNPRGHALYASKRNLVLLSSPTRLREWGVDSKAVDVLAAALPRTVLVDRADADELWATRRRLFFKPVAGYGSRGAYRGAKLTRRVWQSILDSEYVAQEVVSPSERRAPVDDEWRPFKVDLRCYAYAGRVLLLGARMYNGQTTNLRTAGGGLAPVLCTG